MSDKIGQGPKYFLVDLEHHTFYRKFSGRDSEGTVKYYVRLAVKLIYIYSSFLNYITPITPPKRKRANRHSYLK